MKTANQIISEAIAVNNSLTLNSGQIDWNAQFKPVKELLSEVGGKWSAQANKFLWPEGTLAIDKVIELGLLCNEKAAQPTSVKNNLPLF